MSSYYQQCTIIRGKSGLNPSKWPPQHVLLQLFNDPWVQILGLQTAEHRLFTAVDKAPSPALLVAAIFNQKYLGRLTQLKVVVDRCFFKGKKLGNAKSINIKQPLVDLVYGVNVLLQLMFFFWFFVGLLSCSYCFAGGIFLGGEILWLWLCRPYACWNGGPNLMSFIKCPSCKVIQNS